MAIAKIIVDVPLMQTDQPYSYKIPEEFVEIYSPHLYYDIFLCRYNLRVSHKHPHYFKFLISKLDRFCTAFYLIAVKV